MSNSLPVCTIDCRHACQMSTQGFCERPASQRMSDALQVAAECIAQIERGMFIGYAADRSDIDADGINEALRAATDRIEARFGLGCEKQREERA